MRVYITHTHTMRAHKTHTHTHVHPNSVWCVCTREYQLCLNENVCVLKTTTTHSHQRLVFMHSVRCVPELMADPGGLLPRV